MLVLSEWLAELADLGGIEPAGLAAALTARGLTVDAIATSAAGTVLDIDVPANRPDCLGHLGIAREAAAAFSRPMLPSPAPPTAGGGETASVARVRVEAPDLCARYTAGLVRGVRVGSSPPRIVARLEACGLRSVNNVVDASNLVLLELGYPIHTFDLSRIEGGMIRVRRALPSEALTTLDGVARTLDPEMLVIADASRALALAGVMGGADSEIRADTTDVLVEAAWFLPASIRRTARRLAIATDASHRFERGADPEGVLAAQALAARWIVDLAGGVPAPRIVDEHPRPRPERTVDVRLARVERILGFRPDASEVRAALAALGLAAAEAAAGVLSVQIPSWRVDLEREADLAEEVARHLGYDRIPAALAAGASKSAVSPSQIAEARARRILAHLGFHEACNYAMIADGEDDPFVPAGSAPAVAILNPIAEPLSRLRRSLVPGLIRSADLNLRRGTKDVRLFEVGRAFERADGPRSPREPLRIAFVWSGAAAPRTWSSPERDVDVHDAAGLVERLLGAFRPAAPIDREAGVELGGFHPGRSVSWRCRGERGPGRTVAWCGEAHPEVAARFDLKAPIELGEIDLETLLGLPEQPLVHAPLPRVPAVSRDLSFVLPFGLEYARVEPTLLAVPRPAPARLELLDRYEGDPLAEGEVSLTVRVILQPFDRTLTDGEIEAYRRSLVEALERELGTRMRA